MLAIMPDLKTSTGDIIHVGQNDEVYMGSIPSTAL